jgi:hypothetical protein
VLAPNLNAGPLMMRQQLVGGPRPLQQHTAHSTCQLTCQADMRGKNVVARKYANVVAGTTSAAFAALFSCRVRSLPACVVQLLRRRYPKHDLPIKSASCLQTQPSNACYASCQAESSQEQSALLAGHFQALGAHHCRIKALQLLLCGCPVRSPPCRNAAAAHKLAQKLVHVLAN